jgi:single-strand DNA-binding protein
MHGRAAAEGGDAVSLQFNRVQLAGHLTRAPEVKFLAGDRAVALFGIAINRRWKDQSGATKEETTFVDCEAWGKLAEFIGQHFTKATPAFVEGRLRLDQWDDHGTKRSKLKVIVERVDFVTNKTQAAPAGDDPVDHVDPTTGEVFRRSTVKAPAAQKGGAA